MKILVTGGAGFIGSALVRHLINDTHHQVINVDILTYAGNLLSLQSVSGSERYVHENIDIRDAAGIRGVFNRHRPDIVMHLAAESHVDRSIDGPGDFMSTNIIGTYTLLEQAREYYDSLTNEARQLFRFHHVSTDEVYGDLPHPDEISQGIPSLPLFVETTAYAPSSPYSASKASSDHLVRAWHRTYSLPVVITNCSNNYGPYQFPEKLIPLMLLNALEKKLLPVYGKGNQIRDWLYVEDHARALVLVAFEGRIGETYNIGGYNEKTNLEVVSAICKFLDDRMPGKVPHESLITYVADRPGHDMRYAIDASKIKNELGWVPEETFESGLEKTLIWYLENESWWKAVQDGSYQRERLGIMP